MQAAPDIDVTVGLTAEFVESTAKVKLHGPARVVEARRTGDSRCER